MKFLKKLGLASGKKALKYYTFRDFDRLSFIESHNFL